MTSVAADFFIRRERRLPVLVPDGCKIAIAATRHWLPWLGVANLCLAPFSSFSELDQVARQDVWFAMGEDRLFAYFAGIWAPQWAGVRKIKTGIETADLFGFLTTTPSAEVGVIHPKAMPVILTTPEECEVWMTAPWERAGALQRALPDGWLSIVARWKERRVF